MANDASGSGGPTVPQIAVADAAAGVLSNNEKLGVFISYSRDDIGFADQLDAALKLTGFEPTLDRHGISGAENWQEKLGALIGAADTVVFVLTPSSAASKVCAWEVEEAVRVGKRIIPVVPRPLDVATPPPQLASLNYIFFYEEPRSPGTGFGTGLTRLVAALNTDLEWLREHTRLFQRASEWSAVGRPPNRLLSGSDIVDAKAWAARRPKDAPPPTGLHLDFIRASEGWEAEQHDAQQRQLEERERLVRDAETALAREAGERAQREAAQARAAELATREAAQARLVARRTLMGLAVAMVLGMGAAGAGYYAWRQSEITEGLRKQTQLTESGLLANAARQLTDDSLGRDSATAILLALEGLPDDSSDDVVHRERRYAVAAEIQLNRSLRNLRERAVWTGHIAELASISFSRDGTRLLTASHGKVLRAIDAKTGSELASFDAHSWVSGTARFSPDGMWVVTTSDDNTARIWSLKDGSRAELGHVLAHSDALSNARFSDDGSKIITYTVKGAIRLWDAATGKKLSLLKGSSEDDKVVALNRDASHFATRSPDKIVRIWNARNGKELVRFDGPASEEIQIKISSDGTRVLTASRFSSTEDRIVRLWDAISGQELMRFELDSGNSDIEFSVDAKRVMITAWSGVQVWAASNGKVLAQLGAGSPSLSSDGRRVLMVSADKAALWDAEGGKELARFEGHAKAFSDAALSPDGNWVVTYSRDGTLRLWDVSQNATISRLEGHSARNYDVAFNSDGSRVLTASDDKTARVWDASSGKELANLSGHNDNVWSAAFSADGARVVTASMDRTARVWDPISGRELARIDGHDSAIRSAALSSDGKRVVTASGDKTARVWDAATGKELLRLEGHDGVVWNAQFSADNSRIVTVSWDRSIRIWNAATGHELARLEGQVDISSIASFSPDGTRLLGASDDASARIWDAESGRELARLTGHSGFISSAAFSKDGTRVVTTSSDGTLRVWDAISGDERLWFASPGGKFRTAIFSLDGRHIFAVSTESTVETLRLFRSLGELVQTAKASVQRCLTRDQRAAYFLPPSPPTWCVERRLWPYHGGEWQTWLPQRKAWLASRNGPEPELPVRE